MYLVLHGFGAGISSVVLNLRHAFDTKVTWSRHKHVDAVAVWATAVTMAIHSFERPLKDGVSLFLVRKNRGWIYVRGEGVLLLAAGRLPPSA